MKTPLRSTSLRTSSPDKHGPSPLRPAHCSRAAALVRPPPLPSDGVLYTKLITPCLCAHIACRFEGVQWSSYQLTQQRPANGGCASLTLLPRHAFAHTSRLSPCVAQAGRLARRKRTAAASARSPACRRCLYVELPFSIEHVNIYIQIVHIFIL